MTDKIQAGDRLAIRYKNREVEGVCIMASGNSKSLMLGFDAMLGGFVGMMPVLADDDGIYRDLFEGQSVAVVKK